jgi:formate/nitrite transporter FocA (FNT family)
MNTLWVLLGSIVAGALLGGLLDMVAAVAR